MTFPIHVNHHHVMHAYVMTRLMARALDVDFREIPYAECSALFPWFLWRSLAGPRYYLCPASSAVQTQCHAQWSTPATSAGPCLFFCFFLFFFTIDTVQPYCRTGIQVENKKKRGKGQNIGDVGTTC